MYTIEISGCKETSVCSDGLAQSSEANVDTVARTVNHAIFWRIAGHRGHAARIGFVGVPHQIML